MSRPTAAIDRRDAWIAAALAAGVFATRLPFAGAILYHWDSINFALSLTRFDVRAGQPHIPGYPVYVLLGRLVDHVVGDPQRALVLISASASGLAVAALYGLGRSMFDRTTGLIAALLLAGSPLFWFYGAIALPHSVDALMVIVAVWFLFRIRTGAVSLAVPAAAWLGVAGGLRPQTQVFLAPLALYAALRLDWGRRALALGVLAAVDLLWFVPLLQLNGGWTAYFEELRSFNAAFAGSTSVFAQGGWFGLTRNLRKLGMYTLYGLAGALLLVPLAAAPARRWLAAAGRLDPRAVTVLLWVVPVLAYYILVHMGQQGLTFVFLPALFLVLARAVATLPARVAPAATGLAVAAGAMIFLTAPTYPLESDRVKLLTAETLRAHDAMYLPRFAAVTERFPPSEAVILSNGGRFAQYYLSAFRLLPYGIGSRWERGEGEPARRDRSWVDLATLGLHPGADGRYHVVLLEGGLAAYNMTPERAQQITLPNQTRLTILPVGIDERLYLGPDGFGVTPDGSIPAPTASR